MEVVKVRENTGRIEENVARIDGMTRQRISHVFYTYFTRILHVFYTYFTRILHVLMGWVGS